MDKISNDKIIVDKNIQNFQNELKKLLIPEFSNLNYGIYNYLKYKKQELEFFIDKTLYEKIVNILNDEKKSNALQEALSDLLCFFSLYYKEGDLTCENTKILSKTPISNNEVKLYWNNYNQYYIKTGIHFKDYSFKLNDKIIVNFCVVKASDSINSNKSLSKKFFIIKDLETKEKENKIEINVNFEYKTLDKEHRGENFLNNEKTNQKQLNKEYNFKKIIDFLKLNNFYDGNIDNLLKNIDKFTTQKKKIILYTKTLKNS